MAGEKEAEKVISSYQKSVESTRGELVDKTEDKTAAVLWVTNNFVFTVSKSRSSGGIVYDDLRSGVPNLVEEVSRETTFNRSAVSSEKLAKLDADYIILVNGDKDTAMFGEPSQRDLKTVKNNHVLQFGPESSWLYNGPIVSQEMVNDIKEKLN